MYRTPFGKRHVKTLALQREYGPKEVKGKRKKKGESTKNKKNRVFLQINHQKKPE